MVRYAEQVFLNVPFDNRYRKLLDALVFAVHKSGLVARCASPVRTYVPTITKCVSPLRR